MSYIYRHDHALFKTIQSLNGRGGKELFGQVMKVGYNKKTATIKVAFWKYVKRLKYFQQRTSHIHAHDPYEMCRLGDKVCIKQCTKISSLKHHYVRNFFEMTNRISFNINDMLQYEKQAILDNEELRKKSTVALNNFFLDVEEKEFDKKIDSVLNSITGGRNVVRENKNVKKSKNKVNKTQSKIKINNKL